MRDIKHITRKDTFNILKRRKSAPGNFFRDEYDRKPPKKRLRILLPGLAVIIAGYALLHVTAAKNAVSGVSKSSDRSFYSKVLDADQSFKLAAELLRTSRFDGKHLQAGLPGGGNVVYSVDEQLQERVIKVLKDNNVPYGAFVAIEPKTGRILAMAGHSSVDPNWEQLAVYNLYPMASLFKIVTATAALEKNKVTPDTVFAYRGRLTSENPKIWGIKPGQHNQEMPLALAMGKSVNPVFGRLASDVVGKDSIVSCAERFGFNQILFPTPALPSRAAVPQTDYDLRLMGAGLCKEVKISPLHAASIMAAIANNGVMMKPTLAQEIINGKGETIFSEKPQEVRRIVAPETARELAKMLGNTVSRGTSRKAFHDWRGRPKLASINVAAKTGSIDGRDPSGHYSWFIAYAPADNPQIALAALIVNEDKWRIKASYLGEQALESFFR